MRAAMELGSAGGCVGMEAQRSGDRGGLEIVVVWRLWRSGGHASMEPQRSGELEVWRLWRHGGEVWRACSYGGLETLEREEPRPVTACAGATPRFPEKVVVFVA
jgi:hypothetical protein